MHYYIQANNKSIIHTNLYWGYAQLMDYTTQEVLRDTDKDSPTFGNLIIPDTVTQYELSQAAFDQYKQYVEVHGIDSNDLVYDTETGLFEEPLESDLQKVQDRKTEEHIRVQCGTLLKEVELKIIKCQLDDDTADQEAWMTYRKKIKAIFKNPLSYVGQEIPAAPFPVAWDPKGMVLVRI